MITAPALFTVRLLRLVAVNGNSLPVVIAGVLGPPVVYATLISPVPPAPQVGIADNVPASRLIVEPVIMVKNAAFVNVPLYRSRVGLMLSALPRVADPVPFMVNVAILFEVGVAVWSKNKLPNATALPIVRFEFALPVNELAPLIPVTVPFSVSVFAPIMNLPDVKVMVVLLVILLPNVIVPGRVWFSTNVTILFDTPGLDWSKYKVPNDAAALLVVMFDVAPPIRLAAADMEAVPFNVMVLAAKLNWPAVMVSAVFTVGFAAPRSVITAPGLFTVRLASVAAATGNSTPVVCTSVLIPRFA